MQLIDRHGTFVAEWGAYQIILHNGKGSCLAEVRRSDDGSVVVSTGDLPRRTWREAIEWAAAQLTDLGCSAFVDDKYCSIAPFLNFVEEPAGGR